MEFNVNFYRSADGTVHMLGFLGSLERVNPALHNLAVAGIAKLKARDNHGRPLTAPVAGSMGILELRVGRADIARVFFFSRPNREIICTHGYVKKAQRLDSREVSRAERYKLDWEQRFPLVNKNGG